MFILEYSYLLDFIRKILVAHRYNDYLMDFITKILDVPHGSDYLSDFITKILVGEAS